MFGRPNSLLKAAAPIGPRDHDFERGSDTVGLARLALPRQGQTRYAQIRDRETGKASLRLRAAGRSHLRRGSRPPAPVAAPGNGEIAVG